MPGKRKFEPKDWSCGDIIASDDLDRIEKGIQDIDNMIIISSQNPFSTHPESALWFNSAAEEIQVPTYDDFIDLQNDMQPVKDKMKDVVIVSKTNPLEQHPTNVLWFDPTSVQIEIPTYEEFSNLNSKALVIKGALSAGSDLNDIINTGIFFLTENENYINLPASSLENIYGFLTVKNFENIICQTIETPLNIYIRFYNQTWTTWSIK